MGLDEIFQSDKLVQPIWFSPENQSNDLYANAGRARQVAEDQSTWKVGGSSQPKYNWVVEYGKVSPVDPENHPLTKKPDQEQQSENKISDVISQTWNKVGKWWDEISNSRYNLFKGDRRKKALKWFNVFKESGMKDYEALALIGCIAAESGLNYKAVNPDEARGNSTNKQTHGWSGTGEGLIQISLWSNKLPLIKRYNRDTENRQGPKLPETKEEYDKMESNHIANVNEHDAALFVKYYYDMKLGRYKLNSMDDIMSGYYLAKAGEHSSAPDQMQKAYETGIYYNDFHNKQPYRWDPAKGIDRRVEENNFVKALRFTYDMGRELGYFT